jgi:hypothetical protein
MKRGAAITLAAALVAARIMAVEVTAQQDVTGVWTVSLELAEAKAEVQATVKQTGEKLQLTLSGPTGNFELAGTMIKDQLSVNHTMEIQGATADIKMTGTLADDRMSGTIDFLGRGQLKWTAARKRDVPKGDAAATTATPAPAPSATATPVPKPEAQPRQPSERVP